MQHCGVTHVLKVVLGILVFQNFMKPKEIKISRPPAQPLHPPGFAEPPPLSS